MIYLSFLGSLICLNWHLYFITFQGGNLVSQAPLNSTYWAPLDAHDPIKVQQIMLGLTKTSAEKMDLALARDTKICKFALNWDHLHIFLTIVWQYEEILNL